MSTVSTYRRPLVGCTVPAIVASVLLSTSLAAQATPSLQMEVDRLDLQNEMTVAIEPQSEFSLEAASVQPITEAAPETGKSEVVTLAANQSEAAILETDQSEATNPEPSPSEVPEIAEAPLPVEIAPSASESATEVTATPLLTVPVAPIQDQSGEPIATAYRTKSVFSQALNTKLTPGSSLTSYSVDASDILISQDPASLSDQQIDPGTDTQTGSSYFGFGLNLGLSGSRNALTGTSFAVISKIGLNRYLSVRPTVLIRNDVYLTLPLTFDFEPIDIEGYKLGPYVGGGVGVSTGNVSYIRPLLTTGIDLPLGRQFTGNVALNFAFFDTVDVGLIFGVGYNFKGF